MPEIVTSMILKWIGAIAGGVLSLLYMPPRHWRDFVRRSGFSAICALVFGEQVRDHVELSVDALGLVAGATIAAALGWVIMEALVRLVRAYRRE